MRLSHEGPAQLVGTPAPANRPSLATFRTKPTDDLNLTFRAGFPASQGLARVVVNQTKAAPDSGVTSFGALPKRIGDVVLWIKPLHPGEGFVTYGRFTAKETTVPHLPHRGRAFPVVIF